MYFLGSQDGSHGRVWNHMEIISFYPALFKEVAHYFLILFLNEKTCIRLGSRSLKKKIANVRMKSSKVYIIIEYIPSEEIYECIPLKFFVTFSINTD